MRIVENGEQREEDLGLGGVEDAAAAVADAVDATVCQRALISIRGHAGRAHEDHDVAGFCGAQALPFRDHAAAI